MARIMFTRHAEKPFGTTAGVGLDGTANPDDLIVLGWQRAGALVRFFAPHDPASLSPGIATPTAIFASDAASPGASLRPQHTVLPLSQELGITIDTSIAKKDKKALAAAAIAAAAAGPVLVAWQHDVIPDLVDHVAGSKIAPRPWPGDRFDMVWVLDQAPGATTWTFSQVPQLLLAGDSAQPIT
ncbi:hypothetical protein NDN01_14835 [Sphingomonas sp. QA11]|uniref:hypothetical protein n=1 Tax=Sphingomonas sp. QA11 TaxID=2950605 RepID=UPI00234B6AB1|nr:hypothetical protein [Sphingomonas sp. QA11]WCM25337.1 hypothetical protein NDN01_14835 [Sphingomonas sp. QA11]